MLEIYQEPRVYTFNIDNHIFKVAVQPWDMGCKTACEILIHELETAVLPSLREGKEKIIMKFDDLSKGKKISRRADSDN